jgi:hypothetical protein
MVALGGKLKILAKVVKYGLATKACLLNLLPGAMAGRHEVTKELLKSGSLIKKPALGIPPTKKFQYTAKEIYLSVLVPLWPKHILCNTEDLGEPDGRSAKSVTACGDWRVGQAQINRK